MNRLRFVKQRIIKCKIIILSIFPKKPIDALILPYLDCYPPFKFKGKDKPLILLIKTILKDNRYSLSHTYACFIHIFHASC